MLEKISWWLVLIGGLNWLLVGLFQFDAVMTIAGWFGGGADLVARLLYVLVGLASVYLLPQAFGVQMIKKKN